MESTWNATDAEVLATLRADSFDIIVIEDGPSASGTESMALSLVEAIRASGTNGPIAVILAAPDDDRLLQLAEFDCEVLVSVHGWHSRALVASIRRAVTRGHIRQDVSALEVAARRGRARERDEAETQLQALKSLVTGAERGEPVGPASSASRTADGQADLPDRIHEYYGELLKTYVMMGSGNLGRELQQLAKVLSLSGASMRETLSLHLSQVESLVRGLGNRSSRHILARADLLALELMIQLGECYRNKSRFRGLGDDGVDLLHARMLLDKGATSTGT